MSFRWPLRVLAVLLFTARASRGDATCTDHGALVGESAASGAGFAILRGVAFSPALPTWSGNSPALGGTADFLVDFYPSGSGNLDWVSVECDGGDWSHLRDGAATPLHDFCGSSRLRVLHDGQEDDFDLRGTITATQSFDANGNGTLAFQLDVTGEPVDVELDAYAVTLTFADHSHPCSSGDSGCGCTYGGWRPGGD